MDRHHSNGKEKRDELGSATPRAQRWSLVEWGPDAKEGHRRAGAGTSRAPKNSPTEPGCSPVGADMASCAGTAGGAWWAGFWKLDQ